jgi:2-haloacid dehalogenase
MLNLNQFDVLTFDCYGTLIDWENGILNALRPILLAHQVHIDDEQALTLFGTYEAQVEQAPYKNYRTVLQLTLSHMAKHIGFKPTPQTLVQFGESVKDWPAFSDSAQALQVLKKRYKLAIVSNIDDDLFAHSAQKLKVQFDWVITAQQVQTYKPALNHFFMAIERINLPKAKILHVAQSLFHDHVPAKSLGLSTVWVNRRHGKDGWGATPPANAMPDLEVPDLQTLANHIS